MPPFGSPTVERQLVRYVHTAFQVIAYETYAELAERLSAIAPPFTGKARILLVTSVAEAVENTNGMACVATGRSGSISPLALETKTA